MKRPLLVLVLVLMAGSLPAQNYGFSSCYYVRYEQPFCYCLGMPSAINGQGQGYYRCQEHNPCIDCYGPGWCETYESCTFWYAGGIRDIRRVFAKEQDSIAILDFLLEFEKMTEKQRASFVAEVDDQVGDGLTECEIEARHDAYRAKFKELMGVELRPGYIPMPPSRTKNRAPGITASMSEGVTGGLVGTAASSPPKSPARK